MVRKNIEEINDKELLELYKLINDFIAYLDKEKEGETNAKWI